MPPPEFGKKTLLETKLADFPDKRYKVNEMFNLIKDFILNPLIGELIETSNKIHEVHVSREGYNISCLKVVREKNRRSGFLSRLLNLLRPWDIMLKIRHKNGIFLCEYYSYSSLVDKVKDAYYEKLHASFGCEFVTVSRI